MAHRNENIPQQQKQAEQVAPLAPHLAPHATNTSQQFFLDFLPCCADLVSVGIYFTKLRNVLKNEKV